MPSTSVPGKAWKKALSTDAVGGFFLSTKEQKETNNEFKALVLNVLGGNKDCPVRYRKESCAAVVKWDGTKFTYKPL